VCAWANLVGAQICAEGVETEEQWRELLAMGVHLGQGWFLGAPSAPGPGSRARAGSSLDMDYASS
jgi:EAL domain-containing protein (putative c-di-GMP-specific phosphodiesterase class I)